MNKIDSGFTLIEVMIVVTIIGILSATVSMSISSYVLERKGEEKVVAFYNQLQQMRAYAQRNNARYLVTLDAGAAKGSPSFQIFRDVGPADYEGIAVESEILFPDQTRTANLIIIGDNGISPAMTPDGDAAWAVGGISGEWEDIVAVETDLITNGEGQGGWVEVINRTNTGVPGIVFENDAVGTISSGILFLRNVNRDNVCYAIVRPLNENVLRLWKWKSDNWTEL